MNISSMPWTLNEKTHSTSPLCGADRQEGYASNYTLKMALWFISYATTSILFIVYYPVYTDEKLSRSLSGF